MNLQLFVLGAVFGIALCILIVMLFFSDQFLARYETWRVR